MIATHLLQSGMRIEDITIFSGHKNIDSTQRYLKVNLQGLHNQLKKFHPLK